MNLRPYPVLREILVTTKSDRTFRGLLWRRRGAYLVLRKAQMCSRGREPVAMDGELAIPTGNIDFVQVVG